MHKTFTLCSACILSLFLVGCSDTWGEIKDAASGINTAADQAATAISQDVHSVRAIDITYNDQTFTVDSLFKSILRDVQWHYEPAEGTNALKVTGTWQPGLFAPFGIPKGIKDELAVDGEVTIILAVENNTIQEDGTVATLLYHDETIIAEDGQGILHHLYDCYTAK
ncbi:MAG: hypothetical protein ACI33P_16240 [Lysinibacillus sp.]